MGLFSRNKPKIKVQAARKEGFSGWLKCSGCHELIHDRDLAANLCCCPKCNHHYRLPAIERIKSLTDPDSFVPLYESVVSTDVLNFVDTESYRSRLEAARAKSSSNEGVSCGVARLNGLPIALGVLDFDFMGGSMGSVVGERVTRLIEQSAAERLPLIIVSASGGARMQESIFSLMQMAKTSAALARLDDAGVPYISVLTNPTSGGVTASFASLGDIIIAEPKALICFAGPRVIEQTIQAKLPPEAQHSEFLVEHGLIDCIVPRGQLRQSLIQFISLLSPQANKSGPDDAGGEVFPELSSSLEEFLSHAKERHGSKMRTGS